MWGIGNFTTARRYSATPCKKQSRNFWARSTKKYRGPQRRPRQYRKGVSMFLPAAQLGQALMAPPEQGLQRQAAQDIQVSEQGFLDGDCPALPIPVDSALGLWNHLVDDPQSIQVLGSELQGCSRFLGPGGILPE